MATRGARGSGSRPRPGAGASRRAAGAYLFALLLLAARRPGWCTPNSALLDRGTHLARHRRGCAVAALLAWLFPVGALPRDPRSPSRRARLRRLAADVGHRPGVHRRAAARKPVGLADDALVAQGSRRRSCARFPACRTCAWCPSCSPRPTRAARSPTSQASSTCATCFPAACSVPPAACASSPCSPTPARASRPGASPTSATWTTCSRCSASWPRRSPSRRARATSTSSPDDLYRQPPQGLSAWSLTHKALTFWTVSYTREASAEAIGWLEQALALEPGNAMAHVLLGFVLNQRVINSFAEDPYGENRPRPRRGRDGAAARAARRHGDGVCVARLAQLRAAAEGGADGASRRGDRAVQHDRLGLPGLRTRLERHAPRSAPRASRSSSACSRSRQTILRTRSGTTSWRSRTRTARTTRRRASTHRCRWTCTRGSASAGHCWRTRSACSATSMAHAVPSSRRRCSIRASTRRAFAAIFCAISAEIGDSVSRQTQGLVRAGLVAPQDEQPAT